MNPRLILIALGGLLAGFLPGARANLLSNPDLDTTAISSQVLATPVNWTVIATKSASGSYTDGVSSESFANVQQSGGFGVFFKPFGGTTSDLLSVTMYQDVAATVGATYTLTGWAGAGAGYVGLSNPGVKSQFELEFLGTGNSVLGTSTLDLAAAGLGTTNGNPFNYANYTLSGTAPAGTLNVRSEVRMLNAFGNPLGGDQAYVADSFNLTAVAPSAVPLPPAALGGVAMLALMAAPLLRRRFHGRGLAR